MHKGGWMGQLSLHGHALRKMGQPKNTIKKQRNPIQTFKQAKYFLILLSSLSHTQKILYIWNFQTGPIQWNKNNTSSLKVPIWLHQVEVNLRRRRNLQLKDLFKVGSGVHIIGSSDSPTSVNMADLKRYFQQQKMTYLQSHCEPPSTDVVI